MKDIKVNLDDLIRETSKSFSKEFESSIEDNQVIIKRLIATLAELVEVVADSKIKVPNQEYHSQTLVGKIIFTSHSILSLSKGFEYELLKRKGKNIIIDYTSIFILTRALIENYVTLCYLYKNDLSKEEKLYRYILWEVSGLISRQKWAALEVKTINKKVEESSIVNNKLTKIESLPEYSSLEKSKLNKLKKYGLPRIESWNELINQSDLNEELFSDLYSYLSSYAHSEYISILQISQSNLIANDKKTIESIRLCFRVVKMILSLSIEFYINKFNTANIMYNTYPVDIQETVKFYIKLNK